ncbi:MAG: copper resistance protein CopC [Gammaproteobacteria bacterium]|nr:MAG: copper resistance protein CopC [Gammaproteobacteria bacterium]
MSIRATADTTRLIIGALGTIVSSKRGSVPADGGVVATPPGTVVLTLSEPAPGTYVVSWRAASADGDVMPGRIRFTVSGGAASQGERR